MLRAVVAAVTSVAVALVAFAFVAIGFGHYSEDLCFTAVDPPAGAGGVRGPSWRSPVHYDCDFGEAGVVSTTDVFPLGGALVGALVTLAFLAVLWWLLVGEVVRARRSPARGRASKT